MTNGTLVQVYWIKTRFEQHLNSTIYLIYVYKNKWLAS